MKSAKKAVKIEANLPTSVSAIGRPKFSWCTLGIVLVAVLIVILTPAVAGQSVGSSGPVTTTHLEVNATREPLGLDDPTPRFNWRIESSARNVMQRSFRVLVASSPDILRDGGADVWDSGEIVSSEPFAAYGGPALASRTRYFWSVRVRTSHGHADVRSGPSWFETALLDPREWQAAWIAGPERPMDRRTPEEGRADDAATEAAGEFCRPVGWPTEGFFSAAVPNPEGRCRPVRPAPMLRTSFDVTKPVVAARIYTSGLGYNDLSLNGRTVSDDVLDPGFTDYSKTLFYTVHDVTDLVREGENVIASQLGSGQFDSSTRTWDWGWDLAEWRATPRLLLQLHLRYADGTEALVTSDGSWKVSTEGPIRYDSYYLGETYDARRELRDWNVPGFDDSGWPNARVVEAPAGRLRAQPNEPMRVVDVRDPGARSEPSPGVIVYDVGQNLTGWARIRVNAPTGTAVEVFYSEKLDSLGRAKNDPGYALVGGKLQTDYYVAAGRRDELWRPRFSYKGFRYVQLSGPDGQPLPPDASVAIESVEQVRSALETTSRFEAGNGLLEQIHANTKWAVESNVHGIVTDTPVYEKNAWTGDAQLSAGVIATLFDAERLYGKLVLDMLDAQTEQGEVPLLIPSNEHYGYAGKPAFKPLPCCGATPAWDAFLFVIPWEAYRRYGDVESLERAYPAMRRYLDEWIPQWTDQDGDAFDHTLTSGLGDWDAPEGTPTNIALASTAYYAHAVQTARKAAGALGESEDAAYYSELFDSIRVDFNRRFLSPDGTYRDTTSAPFTQTAQILPLAFGLAPENIREDLATRLAEDIRGRDDNPYVGILGARYLLPVLSEAGYTDLAYTVATQTDYPSWGYWIDSLGWTGLGEYWEATSRSRNHHFFGTIVQWMYEHLVGIRPIEPGYARIAFRPEMPAGLDHAAASHESVRGVVAADWRRTESGVELNITVPANATGLVHLPTSDPEIVTARVGGADPGLVPKRREGDRLVYEVGSGRYQFRIVRSQ